MESKYVVLLSLAFLIMLWLSFYVMFNFEDVKILMKQHVFVHWSQVWQPLSEEDKQELQTYHHCTDQGPPNTECWDALQEKLFVSWKYGGFIVFASVVLLPFNIFLLAQRVGWIDTFEQIQSVMALIMLCLGLGCFVLAYSVASSHVVPAVLTGLVVTFLALVQLVPNYSKKFCKARMERFETESGKVLFVVFTALAIANLAFSIWCITSPADVISVAGKHFDLYMNDTALVGVSSNVLQALGKEVDEHGVVDTVGWASLLLFEFLVVQALVNLSDWRKHGEGAQRAKGRQRMSSPYSQVPDAEAGRGASPRRTPRGSGRRARPESRVSSRV